MNQFSWKSRQIVFSGVFLQLFPMDSQKCSLSFKAPVGTDLQWETVFFWMHSLDSFAYLGHETEADRNYYASVVFKLERQLGYTFMQALVLKLKTTIPMTDPHHCSLVKSAILSSLGHLSFVCFQFYLPSVLFVMLSWITFWMEIDVGNQVHTNVFNEHSCSK